MNGIARVVLLSVALMGPGCKSERSEDKPTSREPNQAAPLQAPVEKVLNPEAPQKAAVVPATPRVKREVLVGGCLATCEDPTAALNGFLTAVMRKDIKGAREHLNTARLVHNGTRLGDEWAALYLAGSLGERRESIDKWLKTWLTWVDRLVDPSDRRVMDGSVQVSEQNQRRLVVRYRPPDRRPPADGSVDGTEWQLVLMPRGLEWLITEVNEHPTRTR